MRTTRRVLGRGRHWWAALLLPLLFAACGGGGGAIGTEASGVAGTALIGRSGGVLAHEDGAAVHVPPEAFAQEVRLQIAKDSGSAPPLPVLLEPAGAVYAITPHGGGFERPVEVVVPVQKTSLADNEQLLLVTAQPGASQWHVLSGARYDNGLLRAQVAHFSYFQAVVIRDQTVPALVVTIDNKNNSGAGGAQVIAPGFEISTGTTYETWNPQTGNSTFTYLNDGHALEARLRFPAPALRGAAVPAATCAPASYGHEGAAWRFQRGLQILPAPNVVHRGFHEPPSKGYPLSESQLDWSSSPDVFPGFGAMHFYNQDNPRRGELAGTAGDPWALPPAGNALADDVLTWRGWVNFNPAQHNGAMLVSVTVPTACGLFVDAAPLSFRLNEATGWGRFDGLHAVDEQTQAVAGEPVSMAFRVSGPTMAVDRVEWLYSTDRQHWQALPPGAVGSGQQIGIASPNVAHQGYYRANACGSNIDPDLATPSTCVAGTPTRLVLVPGELPRWVFGHGSGDIPATEGQPVELMAAVDAWGSRAAITWQKRTVAAAAFGFTDWTDITDVTPVNTDCDSPFGSLSAPGGHPVTYTNCSQLTLTPRLDDSYTQIRAVATHRRGIVVGGPNTLLVTAQPTAPTVVSQPASLTVQAGSSAAFVAGLTGSRPMNYQWQFNEADLTGANSAGLTLNNVTAAQAGRYRLVVRNAYGAAVTLAATLVVTDAGVPAPAAVPVIAAHPLGLTVTEGQTAQLAVGATGTGPLAFQWFKDGAPLAGATAAGLAFSPATVAHAGSYTVRVSNGAGSVTSNAAVLAVNVAPLLPAPQTPVITTAPASLAVLPGAGATLAVAATGTGPLAYQWRRDGVDLPGATGAVLHLAAVSALDAGSYSVEVRNAAGGVISSAATLTLIGAPAITTQPAAQSVVAGSTASFSVAASGSGLRYQWTRNGVAIAGATASSYGTPATTLADSGSVYGVLVYNGAGIAVSQGAVLSVAAAPVASPEDKIAAGLNHTCAIDRTDALYCWGNGVNGELGNGSAGFRAAPTRVGGLGAVKAVAAGSWATCAIDGADALWCWGSMGDSVPAQLSATGVRVRAVGLGSDHGCYIDDAGQVFCWGNTSFGKRGELNPGDAPTAVRRADDSLLRDAVAVAVGVNHSCAQLSDGSVWCWGADVAFGSHDMATRVMRRLPDGSRTDFTASGRMVAGRHHTCAIDSGSGQPMCWGHNGQGQLGDGSTTSRDDAMPAGLSGALSLAAGNAHTCAIRAGDMVCWGDAFMGNGGEREQLLAPLAAGRVGAYSNSADPPRVAVAGERHTCALRSSGDVQCWGWNNAGQVGTGSVSDTVNVLVPTSTTLGARFWTP